MGRSGRSSLGLGVFAGMVLGLACAPAAGAVTGLSADPAWLGGPFGHDFAYGDQGPRAMAADGERIWVLSNRAGSASGAVLTVLHPDGSKDAGFSGDGELPIDIGPTDGSGPYGWDVVTLPNGDAAVLSDRVITGESDLAIEVIKPDGTPDPAFAGDGTAVVAGPGAETPLRLAYDATTSRFLVTGETFQQGGISDTFVAAITWGGAADAGFGTAGFRVFDGGGIDHGDFGDAIAPLGDGRIAVWVRWNAGGEIVSPDPKTAVYFVAQSGAAAGEVVTDQMTYGRDLGVVDGTLVGVGSRGQVGVSSESMVMRLGLDGRGLTQTPVDLVPAVQEGLDRLDVAPAAILVSGLQLRQVGQQTQRSAIAARLSRTSLQPLEPALTEVPDARDGYDDVAVAPGVTDGLLLTTFVGPGDTAVFRAVPGALPVDPGAGLPGAGGIPGGAGADRTRPRITGLAVTPVIRLSSRLPAVVSRAAPGLRFRLSEPATVTLTFQVRLAGRWQRVKAIAVTLRSVAAGQRAVRFTGRISKHRALKPGRYRVVMTAVDRARNVSHPASAGFRLVRPHG